MNLSNKKNEKDKVINIEKKTKSNKSKKTKERANKKEKTSKKSKSNKKKEKNSKLQKKKPSPYWKKLEFPISQWSGKIIKDYKKMKIPNNLYKEDIDIILKLIFRKSHKFSVVKSSTRLISIFIFLILLFIFLGIFHFIKKKYSLGITFFGISIFLIFVYLRPIKTSIHNKYKKCHQDLFYITDHINRKYLGDLGYYLLIDYNFKFIGIYIIPLYIKHILDYRDQLIELKKSLKGDTIDHLHKKVDQNKFDKSNSYINNSFYTNNYKTLFNTNLNYFTFGYNYNNNLNNNNLEVDINNDNKENGDNNYNDVTVDVDENDNHNDSHNDNYNTFGNNKIKFNNFFKNDNNCKNENGGTRFDIEINKRRTDSNKIFKNNKKVFPKGNINYDKMEKYDIGGGNKSEAMNSQMHSKSIDKLKELIENEKNGLGIINNKI